jgi:oligoendopeptidase F
MSKTDAADYRQSDRSKVPDEFKWKLDDLYATTEAWKEVKASLTTDIQALGRYRGKLSRSPSSLLGALECYWGLEKDFAVLNTYASMLSDQDTRESPPLAMVQQVTQLMSSLDSAASFIAPELLKVPVSKIKSFMKKEARLSDYSHFIDDTMRRKAHTLNEEGEKLIAEAGLMSEVQESMHRILSEADLPYPTIKLSDGTSIRVNQSNYVLYRESPNRADRKATMDAFFAALKAYERTFGVALYGEIRKDLFYRNARNHKTCLETALFRNNIPAGVYTSLVKNINESMQTLHRYLKLKREMLGLDDLHYYDLYAPMVKEARSSYTFSQSKKLILEATACLSKEYAAVMEKAFSARWIDVYPTMGKRSGAYMAGDAYDFHPYVLTNFNDNYDSVSTLAHELGHAAHSYFSNKHQPYVNSRYPIFLAEVASTVNEALLVDHVLGRVEDKAEKISLLGGYLEQFRTTLFRQTQFAEYELRIHEAAEKGEALTGEGFTAAYLKTLKKYYGHAKGFCAIDDPYGIEWAFIPHFYLNFYVFQYSTSFTASQAIAAKILEGNSSTIEKYLDFLKSGCSDYAIPTLKRVGIDMERPEPFKLALSRMGGIMDQIDELR